RQTPPFGGQALDEFNAINYTFFQTAGDPLHDPECVGWRAGLAAAKGPYTGGFHPAYTYPDLNMMALAAVKADGPVLVPSFHRPWLFNPNNALNDTTNLNWTNASGKSLILRPRPIDHYIAPVTGNPLFPYPADATGDVKNLVGAPGGNDSIWIDL